MQVNCRCGRVIEIDASAESTAICCPQCHTMVPIETIKNSSPEFQSDSSFRKSLDLNPDWENSNEDKSKLEQVEATQEVSREKSISLNILERVDGLCLKFEDSWKTGSPPSLAAYVAQALDSRERKLLLKELLALELHFRKERDEVLSVEKLYAQFPDDKDLIEGVISEQRNLDTSSETLASLLISKIAINGYEILEEIGRGGMGVVYKAKHLQLNRIVALKMILAGVHAQSAQIQRFLSEAEAVATLQHPNIVQVFEVGHSNSIPFMALEFVSGGSLSSKLNANEMTVQHSAHLIEQLAHAMNAAHQAGIVHRDLKPDNVLLTEESVAKITDFGLAKKVEDPNGLTQTGAIMGTPSYMAPEQAEGEGKRVGPAADVYALGGILYHCLTGKPPFHANNVWDTIAKVRTEDPVPPKQHNAKIPKDLQTICLKCLEKDPSKRYSSAEALAEDLRRYRNNEPISARPVGTAERLVKWIKRRPAQASLIAVSLTALLTLIVGGMWFNGQLREQVIRTKQKADDERLARQDADTALSYARKGNEILGSVFKGLDPNTNYENVADLRNALRDNLEKAVQELEGSAIGDPLEVSKMQNILGYSLLGLGDAKAAETVLEKALATHKHLLGIDHPDTLTVMNNLASAYQANGSLAKALPLFEETLNLSKAKLGADNPDTLTTMSNLASAYQADGKVTKAVTLFEETLQLRKKKLGPNHAETLNSMNNLATAYRDNGQLDKALPLYAETFELTKAKFGHDHPNTLSSLNNLALGYKAAGELDRALPLLEMTLEMRTKRLGADHPNTLSSMGNLGQAYQDVGKMKKALPLLEETLRLMRAKLGPDHPNTLISMNSLALGYQAIADLEKARSLLEDSMKLMMVKLGKDHPTTLTAMNNLAWVYRDANNFAKAVPLLEETLKLRKANLRPDHPDIFSSMNNLGLAYRDIGRMDKALPLFQESFEIGKEQLGADHHSTLKSMNNLALAYHDLGKLDKAIPLYEETLERTKNRHAPSDSSILTVMNNLAGAYLAVAEFDKALPLYEEVLQVRKANLGLKHPSTLLSMNNIALAYHNAGQLDKALPLYEETLKLRTDKLGLDHPDTCISMNNLANGYFDVGKLDLALPLLEDATLGMHRLFGPQHPSALKLRGNLVRLYQVAVRDPEKWHGFLEKSFESRLKKFGDSQIKTLMVMTALGASHRQTNDLDKAQPLLEKAVRWQQEHLLGEWAGSELFALYMQKGKKGTKTKISGSLSPEMDAGHHETKLSAGTLYAIDMTSTDFDTFLRLENTTGRILVANDDIDAMGRNLNSRIVFSPLADGIYRLVATSYQNRGRGNYEIVIRDFSNGKRLEIVTRKSHTTDPKTKPIEVKNDPPIQTINDQLTKENSLDTFPKTKKSFAKVHEVELKKGEIYQIDLTAKFDPYLRIETANKVALLDNDDASSSALDSRLIFRPDENGIYRLIATSYKPGETGEYKITISPMKKSSFNKSFKESLVESQQTLKGKFVKLHKLQLDSGTPYTIHLASKRFDSFLILGDDDARRFVAQNDDISPGNTKESRIDFTPTRTGNYTVLVTSFAPGETGDYELTVQGYEPKKE